MKYIILIILLTGCKTAYGPSSVRAGSDLGITHLLEKGNVTDKEALVILESLRKILTNKDLTVALYNASVRTLLSKYQGAGQLANILLISAQAKVSEKITPEYLYVVNQGMNQMELAIKEWSKWKNLKKKD